MQKNIICYSAITNFKDKPRNDIQVFSEYNKFVSPVMNAKIYKILPHKYLNCDISVWLDGNIFLNMPIKQFVEKYLGDADIAVFQHNHSPNIDYEMKWIKYVWRSRNRRVYEETIKQVEHYKKLGLTDGVKMAMCSLIIRRHIQIVNNFNEAWWAEICSWSQRDQLSFPIVLKQFPELKINYIQGNIKNCPIVRYETHNHFNT